jgi:hypothetical protein
MTGDHKAIRQFMTLFSKTYEMPDATHAACHRHRKDEVKLAVAIGAVSARATLHEDARA